MRGSGVDHLDLVVSSLERSLPLYTGLLEPLGYHRTAEIRGERGERVVYIGGEPGKVAVSLREAQSEDGGARYDRYAIGLHHIAFEAPDRETVDDRIRWASEAGFEIENDPREYDYDEGYYAGFIHDPDGIKLEVVHVPGRGSA